MMRVQNEASSIVETDPSIVIKKYEKMIKELKQELTMHDALVERTGVVYDEHTPEQKYELMKMVRSFSDATPEDEDDKLNLTSLRQIKELFRQFKLLLKNAEDTGPVRDAHSRNIGSRTATSNASREGGVHPGDNNLENENLVGTMDEQSGFALGVAPNSAMPATLETSTKKEGQFLRPDDTIRSASPVDQLEDKNNSDTKDTASEEIDKNEAYLVYDCIYFLHLAKF